MNITKSVIAVSSNAPQTGFVVTLEGTSLFLTILISTSVLLATSIKIISKFNSIVAELKDLREELASHSNLEGHPKLLEPLKLLQKDVAAIDKKIDIHLQDYTNFKDANLLQHNGASEQIKHVWNKTEKLFTEQRTDIKDLQQFLQKQQNFRIRE